jgi:hypothetical protein
LALTRPTILGGLGLLLTLLLLQPPWRRRAPVVPLLLLREPLLREPLILIATLVALVPLRALWLVPAPAVLASAVLAPPLLAEALQTPLAPPLIAALRHGHHLREGARERWGNRRTEEIAEGTAPPHLLRRD